MSLYGGDEEYEVVVIGNGPNALALSYMLSGNWPYYIPHHHPDPLLDHKLCQVPGKSLIERDLEYLSEGLEGRSYNPIALLFDQLQRPNTDFGFDEGSCLKWHHHSNKAVSHLVLGCGPPGGSWHNMAGSQLTLSLNNWLELPGWEFQNWLRDHRYDTVRKPCILVKNGIKSEGNTYDRATTSHVAEYYRDYVDGMGLSKNFWNDAKVLSIKRVHCITKDALAAYLPHDDRGSIWEIQGVKGSYPDDVKPFVIHSHSVVLATGNNIPKVIGVPGEKLPFVFHHMTDIDELVEEIEGSNSELDPCLVVGAGLTAADAILALESKGIPVIHSIRRPAKDHKIILNQLQKQVYPEYASISSLMKGEAILSSYKCIPKSKLVEIRDNKECILKHSDGTYFKQKVSYVFILIGASPDLSYLTGGIDKLGLEKNLPIDSKKNPIDINPFTHESVNEPGLYALGPLIGDNFVRFGMGGGLGVVNHIFQGDDAQQCN